MDTKLLVIDDDINICEMLRLYFENEGYKVKTAHDGMEGISCFKTFEPDLVLLDIMLPGGSGLQLLEHLKRMGRRENVIIISARDSIEDKVEGLDLGADDYLPKPFHLAELLSRIKSVMRRNNQGGEQYVSYGNVKVNPHTFDVWIGDAKKELSRKEFDLLLYFLQRPNRLVSKSMLAEAIWGDHFDDVDNYDFVYAQIKNLRKRLTAWEASIEITSVYGMGYKLIEN